MAWLNDRGMEKQWEV